MVVTESCPKARWNRFCLLMGRGKVWAGWVDPQTLSWLFLENTVCHGHYQCYREGRWIGSREGNVLLSAWVSRKCQNSLVDSVGEGEGGMIWENGIETCIIPYMKRIAVHVRCMILDAWGWCTGTTRRDGMGREVGRGFRMGNTCTPVADLCMAKPIQYCKVINLQLK